MPLIKRQFKTSSPAMLWGYLFMPAPGTYDILSLLIHGHGVGEGGSTEASVEAMLTQSPLALVKEGETFVFTNQLSGKRHGFAVLCLQAPNGWLDNRSAHYAVVNDLPELSGEKPRVHVMGLSAGGDFVMDFITDTATMPLITSAIPMSPAGVGNTANYPKLKAQGIKVWSHSGNKDGGYTQNATSLCAGITGVGGDARQTLFDGGHGGWVNLMKRTAKWNTWGGSMNLFEFMMAAETPGWVPDPVPSSELIGKLELPGAFRQPEGTYLVNKSEQVFDATGSQNINNTTSDAFVWGWQVVKAGTYGAQWLKTATDNQGAWGPGKRSMTRLADGIYQVSVTMKSLKDASKTVTVAATMEVKIGAAIPTEPVPDPEPLTVQSIDFTGKKVLLSDGKPRNLSRLDFDLKQKAYLLQTTFEEGDDTFTVPL